MGGLEVSDLLEMVLRPKDYTVDLPEAAFPDCRLNDISSEVREIGLAALSDGSTAHCVLAGGLIASLEDLVRLRTLSIPYLSPLWVMVNPEDVKKVEEVIDDDSVRVFPQFESYRFTPENTLSLLNGTPDYHSSGHGDVINALKFSGILEDFIAKGGKRVVVSNVNNVLGIPSPGVLGKHIISNRPVTCEVVKRLKTDVGGILCRHMGFNQIVEMNRLSFDTDVNEFEFFNTNTMIFNVDLDFDVVKWSWHRQKKNVAGRLHVEYVRLLQDITSNFHTQYVEVPREYRYQPTKTVQDVQNACRIFSLIGP
jgi:hypothetical protein